MQPLKHSLEAYHACISSLINVNNFENNKKNNKKLPGCLVALRIYSLDSLHMLEFQNLKKGIKVSHYNHNYSK